MFKRLIIFMVITSSNILADRYENEPRLKVLPWEMDLFSWMEKLLDWERIFAIHNSSPGFNDTKCGKAIIEIKNQNKTALCKKLDVQSSIH